MPDLTTDRRAARADWTRRYRARNPPAVRRAKERQALRERALRVLGQRHPDELAAIVADLEAEDSR